MAALEPLDELFLALDRGVIVGHSGVVVLFDAADASAPLTVEALRELIERRLEDLPHLRRRPEPDPSRPGGHRWSEEEKIVLADHVHGRRLDGGDDRSLGRLAAQLNRSPLDRSRPLWEMHVIDGLQDERVAVYMKLHHALGDAIPGRLVVEKLFAIDGDDPAASSERPSRAPDVADGQASQPLTAPATRFNRPLSERRDFAFATLPRARVEGIRSGSATTFTDVLLAAWAGALRGWLALRGETPAAPLVARIPISLRSPEDVRTGGNRLAVATVPAPVDQSTASARLRNAHEAMTRARTVPLGAQGSVAAGVVNFALSAFVGSNRLLAWHGAPRIGSYPLALINISGLAITCMTNASDLWVGVHVDAAQVSDPWSLLRAFDLALADLEAEFAG